MLVQATRRVDVLLADRPNRIHPPSEVRCPTWETFIVPLTGLLPHIAPLESGSNRSLEFTFAQQVHSLVYFHVEEYISGRGLLEDLNDLTQALPAGLPQAGLAQSTFFEALNSRGLCQMLEVFQRLSGKAAKLLGDRCEKWGKLRAIDGSLINATLSMQWADYTDSTHKLKAHLCFDLNCGIPRKLSLTPGKGPERPFVEEQITPGETGVMDRGFQDHGRFDAWQEKDLFFVCRIRGNTQKTLVQNLFIPPDSNVFFHAEVYLGDEAHRTRYTVRLVGLRVGRKTFWIVTNRTDLTALEIASIYRLRWEIESFFAWWKRHLNVYHLIARSPYGVMMQLLAGLIAYLLLVIYFYRRYTQRPSLSRLRQLRRDIRKERALDSTVTGLVGGRAGALFLAVQRWGPWQRQTLIVAIF